MYGESVVMRVLDRQNPGSRPGKVGLRPDELKSLRLSG